MRVFTLFGLFLGCLLFFRYQEEKSYQQDYLSTRSSAIKKIRPQNFRAPAPETFKFQDKKVEASPEAPSQVSTTSGDELPAEDESVPWNDIEEGWKIELKEYLTMIDAEKSEEMFSAYLDEKKKYMERTEEAMTDIGGVTEDLALNAKVEYDSRYEELEKSHKDNLREIFLDHYDQIETLHKEYLDSVQYLSHNDGKINFSL